MDITTLRSISPVLVLLAFIGICWWAYSPKRRKKFEEASRLPFVDEPETLKDFEKTKSAKANKRNSL